MKSIIFLFFGIFSILNSNAQTSKADQILGDWISPEKDVIVHVYKEKEHYFGKIVWFKKYNNNVNIDAIDDSKGLIEEKWMNTIVMRDFVFADNEWTDGKIFQLKTGKTYDAFIRMKDANSLRLTGYIFLPIFSESVTFTKYQETQKLPTIELKKSK